MKDACAEFAQQQRINLVQIETFGRFVLNVGAGKQVTINPSDVTSKSASFGKRDH